MKRPTTSKRRPVRARQPLTITLSGLEQKSLDKLTKSRRLTRSRVIGQLVVDALEEQTA